MKSTLMVFYMTSATLLCSAASAQGVHQHGAGQLNIAVDGPLVQLELTAPGADLVGFEHAPSTPEQIAAVETAMAHLSDGASLFSFPAAAECAMTKVDVNAGALDPDHADGDHDDDHADHDGSDHKEDHADHEGQAGHGDHADHDADTHARHVADGTAERHHDGKHHDEKHDSEAHEDHDADHKDDHADVRAMYTVTCHHPEALDHIATRYFEIFPAAQELDVQALTETGQHRAELTPEAARLTF